MCQFDLEIAALLSKAEEADSAPLEDGLSIPQPTGTVALVPPSRAAVGIKLAQVDQKHLLQRRHRIPTHLCFRLNTEGH